GSNGLNGGGGAAAGNSYGSRGANDGCGSDSVRDGRAGENGASGANGSNGVTITASTIFSYFWLPTAKSGDGTDGAGGGGGEGGGGGSGGQGGQAGTGGWGAGSSFAMYLHSSVGTSNNTILTPGAVAAGGDGGHGQGGGGNNVNLDGCCITTLPRVFGNTDVGAGGRGGNGGNGGDGADGADGLSVSVQTVAGGSLTPATSGPIANTISTEILEGCQNSEILIVKDGGTWSLTNGGVYINDLNSGSSSYNNNSANAYISFPATGMKSIDINGVAYDGFILINKTRALPVFDATMESGICEGNSFIMSTSTTGDEYEWVIFNDAASTGTPLATFSTSTASWSTPVTGTATDYKVRLRVKTNCCGWSTPVYYSFSTSATLTGSETSTICYEDTLTINGMYYHANNSTGTEVFTNIGPNGCDSTVTINLNVIPEKVGSVTQTICYEDTLTINGTYYHANNASGTEVFTNIGPNGCDSTVTINLTVIPEKVGNVTETICDGDTLFVGNSFYTASVTGGTEVISNIGPNGCDSTVTIDLTVLAPIDVTLINNAAILTSNENGASYVWLDCDNNYAALSGETDQMFEASLNGNYAVEITLGNCVDTSDCETINSVGITELSNDLISIYPNPTNNIVTVSLNNAIGELNYEVRTIEGKIVVKKSNINSDQFTIDLSLESDGIYFLNISSKEDSKVFNIIKQ
ncbi:MAG: T9SS type A sorting domain-containing protein, partial [Crocinitomicaceae bacterium]|nr:T9SS type A sorting domain-containing protein [Crocinitomicaceae bacterium]